MAARRSMAFGYSVMRPEISFNSSPMTLSSLSMGDLVSDQQKNPIARTPWGFLELMRARLTLVGLSEGRRLSFFRHQLSGGADRLHENRFMLGSVTDDDTELATLTPVDVD